MAAPSSSVLPEIAATRSGIGGDEDDQSLLAAGSASMFVRDELDAWSLSADGEQDSTDDALLTPRTRGAPGVAPSRLLFDNLSRQPRHGDIRAPPRLGLEV